MLQNLRDRIQGWFAIAIASVIALVFTLWGVHNFQGGKNRVVAKVNGEEITIEQVKIAYEQDKRQKMMSADKSFILDQEAQTSIKNNALKRLINERVLLQAMAKMGFRIGNNLLQNIALSIPIFQNNGKFSPDLYQRAMRGIFYSEQAFFDTIKGLVLHKQLESGIVRSGFVLPNELEVVKSSQEQRRDFGYFVIPFANFSNPIAVGEEAIKKYYESHGDEFLDPEMVSIQYLELAGDQLAANIQISESEIKDFYYSNIDLFVHPKQPSRTDSYEVARTRAKELYRKRKLAQKFTETCDHLSDLAYTNPDSLEFASRELGITLQSTGLFTKKSTGRGILANSKIIRAAFSDAVLRNGYNSGLIEIEPGRVVILRIKEHVTEKLKPLDQIRNVIIKKLDHDDSILIAEQIADKLLEGLLAGKSEKALASEYKVVWYSSMGVKWGDKDPRRDMVVKVFTLPHPNEQNIVATKIKGSDGYAVIRLDRVYYIKKHDITTEQKAEEVKFFSDSYGQYDYQSLVASLMKEAKVKILKETKEES